MKKEKNRNSYNEEINEEKKKKQFNREIVYMTYGFLGMIVLVLINFTYFLVIDSKDVINNSYNPRQELLAKKVVRGKILGNQGEVLAETLTEADGTEVRSYPYNNLFCHVVGNYSKNRSGIELSESFNLLTSSENPLVSVYNQMADEKDTGDNVITTLDLDLQKTAYDALGDERGAIVVMEPSTGKILAMVSKPDYNPNNIVKNWDKLIEDAKNKSPLINRATQGLYPPGSTFKMLTAIEYIRENNNFENYTYNCKGNGVFNSVKIKCYHENSHGKVDLASSFAESCNTSFANIGIGLNQKSFRELCDRFLFNSEIPIDIAYKKSSFVIDENSDSSYMPQTALGQGDTQISPFHNALIVSTIANGGILMKPYLVDRIESYGGNVVEKNTPSTYGTIINPDEAKAMTGLMEAVVEEGTGSKLKDLGIRVAGKTGSAEFNSEKDSHAWFVGFAPSDNPKIAVSIVVEGAGSGSSVAVPIAKKIFEDYFKE